MRQSVTDAAISPWLTASHPNSEVKQGRVAVVLRWGTTREGAMLHLFALFKPDAASFVFALLTQHAGSFVFFALVCSSAFCFFAPRGGAFLAKGTLTIFAKGALRAWLQFFLLKFC